MSETDPYKRIEELELENHILRMENKRLRKTLGLHLEEISEQSLVSRTKVTERHGDLPLCRPKDDDG